MQKPWGPNSEIEREMDGGSHVKFSKNKKRGMHVLCKEWKRVSEVQESDLTVCCFLWKFLCMFQVLLIIDKGGKGKKGKKGMKSAKLC